MNAFSREAIEKLLILNGLEPTAPDEEIKSVLLRANWRESEVDTAISVLKENKNHEQEMQTVHQVFRSDEKLSPALISSLLGITVDYSEKVSSTDLYNHKRRLTSKTFVNIILITIGLSLLIGLVSMYFLDFGIFHQADAFTNLSL